MVEHDVVDGEVVGSDLVTITSEERVRESDKWSGWLTAFLAEVRVPTTVVAYRSAVTRWLSWLDSPDCVKAGFTVDTMRTPAISVYMGVLDRSGLSNATVNQHISGISAFYSFLAREGLVMGNPCREVRKHKMSKTDSGTDYLTGEEAGRLVKAAGESTKQADTLVSLLLSTGLRVSEVVNVKSTDFRHRVNDAGQPIITVRVVGKGNKVREVEVPRPVMDKISGLLGDANFMSGEVVRADSLGVGAGRYVFCKADGSPISRQYASNTVSRMAKVAKIDKSIRSHSLRHSFAMLYIASGGNMRTLQMVLGHSSLEITERYLRRFEGFDSHTTNAIAKSLFG